jgi:protection of telomeres protein 1
MSKLRARLFVLWGNVEELKREGRLDKYDEITNLPFTCCIQEYGVPNGDGAYVRMHRIYETTIQPD